MIKARRNKKRFLTLALIVFLTVSIPLGIFALNASRDLDSRSSAVSRVGVSLDPTTGDIPEAGFDIDLIVDTHDERISGVDVTLKYSGAVEYRGFFQGEIENCTVKDAKKVDNEINLQCFIDNDKPTYQGSGKVFATANFRAKGSGAVKIEAVGVFFYVRDARGEVRFLGDMGEYTAQGEDVIDDKVGMDLSPSSGVIPKEGLDINLIVDTHGEEVDGINITIEYSGDVQYQKYSSGQIPGCSVKETKQEGKNINLHCDFDEEADPYKGSGDVFATINFTPVQDGQATVKITKVEFSEREKEEKLNFLGGTGQYTTGSSVYPSPEPPPVPEPPVKPTPDPTPEPTPSPTPKPKVPETSISNFEGIIGGSILILISAIIFTRQDKVVVNRLSMRNKLSD
jgi:hypothetical protein